MSDSRGDDLYGPEGEDTAEIGALAESQPDAISLRMASLLFSDIVAITPFFDKYGDLAGHERIRVHNELLFPVIQGNRGRVVKTIGDAIMAVFDSPDDGVAAAVGMQRALADYNRSHQGEDEAIHVRIGLHTGKAIVDGADMFGDAVNVAARVSSEAEGDQILISAVCQQHLTPGAFPTAFHARPAACSCRTRRSARGRKPASRFAPASNGAVARPGRADQVRAGPPAEAVRDVPVEAGRGLADRSR